MTYHFHDHRMLLCIYVDWKETVIAQGTQLSFGLTKLIPTPMGISPPSTPLISVDDRSGNDLRNSISIGRIKR
jgi:hypothetical protein